jgi:putative Ca2+/H+ antiporter (TMEM165/GDT1 family)
VGVGVNLEKVIFGFFVLLAATLNFGFFVGDISDPAIHNVYELFAAVLVSLAVTMLKLGDRTQIGAIHLASSLVADLQLIGATIVWIFASQVSSSGLTREATAVIVSLSGGALVANVVSVALLVIETVSFQRR